MRGFGILVAVALLARPAEARQAGCTTCADSVQRVEYHRALTRERARMRTQLADVRAQLAQGNLDVHVEKALREAESKLQLYDRELTLRLASASGSVRGVRIQQILRPADGYLGVTYSGNQVIVSTRDGLVAHHGDYPVIESVEPGSPAYRAGLEAGDTVIAYNSEDLLRQDVVLSKLLKPGAQVRVTVRRGGSVRDVEVLVAQRPQALAAAPWPGTSPTQGAQVVFAPRTVSPSPAKPGAVSAGVTAVAPSAPASAAPPTPVIWGPTAVAGAEIVRLNEALGETFGVKAGVLVLNVGRGTPAERAGLRGGDVIVGANGTQVTVPQALLLAVRRATDRQVSLQIVRKQKRQTVDLRW